MSFDKESFMSARAYTSAENPQAPPDTKTIFRLNPVNERLINEASSVVVNSFPLSSSRITKLSSGSVSSSSFPSFTLTSSGFRLRVFLRAGTVIILKGRNLFILFS